MSALDEGPLPEPKRRPREESARLKMANAEAKRRREDWYGGPSEDDRQDAMKHRWLWLTVLSQALEDLVSVSSGEAAEAARGWLLGGGSGAEDFELVCELAQVSKDQIRARARAILADAPATMFARSRAPGKVAPAPVEEEP